MEYSWKSYINTEPHSIVGLKGQKLVKMYKTRRFGGNFWRWLITKFLLRCKRHWSNAISNVSRQDLKCYRIWWCIWIASVWFIKFLFNQILTIKCGIICFFILLYTSPVAQFCVLITHNRHPLASPHINELRN